MEAAAAKGSDSAEAHRSDYRSTQWLLPRQLKWDSARRDYAHWPKSFLREPTATTGRSTDAAGRYRFRQIARAQKEVVGQQQQGHGAHTQNDNAFASRATNLISCAPDEKSSLSALLPRTFYFLCFIIQTTTHKVQRVQRFSDCSDWKMAWTWCI